VHCLGEMECVVCVLVCVRMLPQDGVHTEVRTAIKPLFPSLIFTHRSQKKMAQTTVCTMQCLATSPAKGERVCACAIVGRQSLG
jgi:hypothetical protein